MNGTKPNYSVLMQTLVARLLQSAGITINGPNPWDMQIHDDSIYSRLIQQGSLALGETYMNSQWDCERLDEFIYRILRARLYTKIKINKSELFRLALHRLFNFQTKSKSLEVGRKHYDIGNDLYQAMLDPTMTYSCAYWKDATDLTQAQQNKMDLICRKLQLRSGMRLLDIGCGWGGLAYYAAKHYGVNVVGVTISEQQRQLAVERCQGLPIEIRFQDYRDLTETFDRVVSVGMFEHVGNKNYAEYMKTVYRCLRDDGIFLLHTIGNHFNKASTDPWIEKYIFPNGVLPSMKQIVAVTEPYFVMEDWHNFGADYDKTLLAWYHNFVNNWPKIQHNFDQRFYRMWCYYLLSCAGAFRARDIQLWQIVYTKHGMISGYQSVR